jgi:hypothetical protein
MCSFLCLCREAVDVPKRFAMCRYGSPEMRAWSIAGRSAWVQMVHVRGTVSVYERSQCRSIQAFSHDSCTMANWGPNSKLGHTLRGEILSASVCT